MGLNLVCPCPPRRINLKKACDVNCFGVRAASCYLLNRKERSTYGLMLKGKVLMENRNTYVGKGNKAWTKCIEFSSKLPYHCRYSSRFSMPLWDDKQLCTHYDNVPYGGVNAKGGEFPHMALLGYGAERESAQWLCGGSVISERFILSAAHCSSEPRVGNVTFAALGILKRTDLNDNYPVYKIKAIIKHPEYKSPCKYHDIMLLKTANEINFGKSILPACLDTGKVCDNVLTATGWGPQGPKGELGNHLQAMTLHKYNDDWCSILFPPHRHFKNGYDNVTQMCYGRADKLVDTCEGDSGGPLQQSMNADCVYHILGITSFGKDGETPGKAGIYTRVRYYVPWIESIIWTND
ncbi:unnamed protein product [Arctia plantaginis]|uniref:Peptidase S1 domain-containing protein n=1 Tax=Arctia plantaginis TaxID=874455 RepID=A0A8S1BJS6_ARCPL|nr:unnamed protein product [Arctia plantaginis]